MRCSGLIAEGLDLKKAKAKNGPDLRRNSKDRGEKSTKSSCFELTEKSMTKKDTKQGIENGSSVGRRTWCPTSVINDEEQRLKMLDLRTNHQGKKVK
jgi:hypothetical protein